MKKPEGIFPLFYILILMKKKSITCIVFFLFFFSVSQLSSQPINPEEDRILTSAEKIFKAMQLRDFKGIWECLTEKSKQRIVDDTYKSYLKLSKKHNITVPSKKDIFNDFETIGNTAKEYWEAFLENFDPKTVLEQSTWKMGKVTGNYAEIIIHYRKSERPAILQMYNEKGIWKTGLVETFWTSIR